jgi:hypothetical protein
VARDNFKFENPLTFNSLAIRKMQKFEKTCEKFLGKILFLKKVLTRD